MSDLFDRCINVYIYDTSGKELARVITPKYGPKPEIKVEGCIISNTYQISGKVTITNLERSINVADTKYLKVEMYYRGSSILESMRKCIWYDVQFADQSKQPPNRQVCFNCLAAGVTPDILSHRITINELDANDEPLKDTLENVLRRVIAGYNESLTKTVSQLMQSNFMLNSEPVFRMDASFAAKARTTDVALQWNYTPISTILDDLTMSTMDSEPVGTDASTKEEFPLYCYYIEDQNLVISLNPNTLGYTLTSPDKISLDYVQSAYRFGPIINIKSLFDPRIHQDITVEISSTNVYGKKIAGSLIPLLSSIGSDKVQFRPVGGINFVFSTTGDNYMTFQGCV